MRKHVVIVAGGSGSRMGHSLPKQFIELLGKPVMVHTIEAFLGYDPSIHVVVVLAKDHLATWHEIKEKYLPEVTVSVAGGGASRFQSVKCGLSLVEGGLVAIHDSVRPVITSELIARSYESAKINGSGVVMVPVKDSIRMKDKQSTVAKDRSLFLSVQTPQTFQVPLIKAAFEQEESTLFTDDASVYEANGHEVSVVHGAYSNLKITTPEDLIVVKALLAEQQ